jgi:hypothetical protein
MSALKKIAGFVVGASAVTAIGVAVAQGVPPNPFIVNPALGAGQQSSHLTSMGETGVPGFVDQVQTATVQPAPVAVAPEPAPAPVAQTETQTTTTETQTMGAAPEPAPAPVRVARHDRG